MSEEIHEKDHEDDLLPVHEKHELEETLKPSGMSRRFWISSLVNCSSTASIVFVNKKIFESESLRHNQVTFAAFHFAVTAALLYIISRPSINVFQAKRVEYVKLLPLALAMIFNVVLPNASLAYSSIQFYQVVRVMLTPCVALLNFLMYREKITVRAAMMLIPVCLGVAVVSYCDVTPKAGSRRTAPRGVVFAFTGVSASALYNVWIKRYHGLLNCSSHQLLLNQAPLSVFLMIFVIPFSDDISAWKSVPVPLWALIVLSGILACLINLTQFIIVNEAGPVSSTVVGHFKTCTIIILGWVYSHKQLKDGSLIGIVLAITGIVAYSLETQRRK